MMQPGINHLTKNNMGRNNNQRYEAQVTLNSQSADNVLNSLTAKAKLLRQSLIDASKMGDEKKVKELNQELKSIESTQRSIRKQTYDYNTVLRNINTSTIKDLHQTSKALRNELKRMTPDTQEFIAKSKQLDLVNNRLKQLNGKIQETHSWWSRSTNTLRQYIGVITGFIATVTGASYVFGRITNEVAKMDDTYSDVIKTTGLLKSEIIWLNQEFKKINTRTSREELNNLARDAGKLGIKGKDNILEFVRAADQINVALGEDLGEDSIRNIGKLAEVFKIIQNLGVEKSFLAIGSAINALGQDSTASEAYLVDFTQRIAGVSYQSKLSIQDVLGYASALDQSGQKVEMSATSFQKFLMKMFSDTSAFAKMANMTLSDFKKLLETDVNQAIITVLENLNNKGGFSALVPIFKDMGLDGARAVSVLSSLATNIDLVKNAQQLSNKEFAIGSSLSKEFETKNNNLQAQLEKNKKRFKDQIIQLGEKLAPAYLSAQKGLSAFFDVLLSIDKELIVSAAIFGSTLAVYKTWNLVLGIGNTLGQAYKLTVLGISWAMATVQGNTLRAAAAAKLFNTTFSASAIGIIITSLAALAYGIYSVTTHQSELTKATKQFFSETEKLKREADDLLQIIENSVVGSEEYRSALNKLSEKYGPHINNLIDENGYLTDIHEARKLINDEIERSIGLTIKDQLVNDIVTKGLEKQSETYDLLMKSIMASGKVSEESARIQASSIMSMVKLGLDEYEIHRKRLEKGYAPIGINLIKRFREQHEDMAKEVKKANDIFSSLFDNNDFIGPILKKKLKTKKKIEEDDNEETEKMREKAFKAELKQIEDKEIAAKKLILKMLEERKINQQEYESLILENTIYYLSQRQSLYIKYAQDDISVQNAYYDAIEQRSKKAQDDLKKAHDLALKYKEKSQQREEQPVDDPYEEKVLAKFKKHQEMIIEYSNNVKKSLSGEREERDQELKLLKEVLDKKLITEEQYLKQRQSINLKYKSSILDGINSTINAAAELFFTIKDAEYSRLEMAKEKELALYGDNADKRAEIENKYEKKKFDLQQKYADMEMAVKIAQTISSGAVAAMQAYAQLGPIAGAVAASLMAATTLANIAVIVQQRNAVKSMTFNTDKRSESGMKVNEFYSGGYTGRSLSDRDPVGVVHANEWVAPASMVRNNPIVFAQLERERINKYSIQSSTKQFASGGFTTPVINTDIERTLLKINDTLKSIQQNPILAYTVLSDQEATRNLRDRFKREGSL